jgi:hypothetical protein
MAALRSWWTAETSARRAYALAAVIGLALYVIVFGPRHLLGTSSYWDMPQPDQRAYLIGYRYFLQEPWHWPLFSVHKMNIPYRESIAFTDSIPLWALCNKVLAAIVPGWKAFTIRGYLGVWYAVVYALQACFGVAIVRRLGHLSHGAVIVTASFFLAVPAFAIRYGHASLSAHFLTLSAFYLYLCCPAGQPAPRRIYRAWVAQLACAMLINPYHTVMSLGLFVVALLRSRSWRAVAQWLGLGMLAITVAAWLVGYLSPSSGAHMPGFELASTNLLSMVVPVRSFFFGDAPVIANVLATEFQYEGWAFLGLGLLVLLVWSLPSSRGLLETIRHHKLLFALVVLTWMLSLSSRIYFGSHLIAEYDIPDALRWIPDQFRAPGRFVWLPMYAVIIYLLHWGLTRLSSGWKLFVLPLLALIQVVDTVGAWGLPLDATDHGRREDFLGVDTWRPFIQAHDAVYVLPSFLCVLDGTPHIDQVSAEIEYLASEKALPINGVYSARPARDCAVDQLTWSTMRVAPNTLYVVLPQAAKVATRLEGIGASCASFAYGSACTTNQAALDAAIHDGALVRSQPKVPTLALGAHVDLTSDATAPYLMDGWSFAESAGRWSVGEDASLVFHLEAPRRQQLTLKLQATAALCGSRGSEDVDIYLRGTQIGTLHFDAGSNDLQQTRSLAIAGIELDAPVLVLELRPRDFRAPSKLRCNNDTRELAVSVKELWFE